MAVPNGEGAAPARGALRAEQHGVPADPSQPGGPRTVAGEDDLRMTDAVPRTYGLYLGDLRRTRNRSHGIINYAVGLANALPAYLGPNESLSVLASDEIRAEL